MLDVLRDPIWQFFGGVLLAVLVPLAAGVQGRPRVFLILLGVVAFIVTLSASMLSPPIADRGESPSQSVQQEVQL
jgi:hypothetical protein